MTWREMLICRKVEKRLKPTVMRIMRMAGTTRAGAYLKIWVMYMRDMMEVRPTEKTLPSSSSHSWLTAV